MTINSFDSNSLVKRIRERVLQLQHGNERTVEPIDTSRETAQQAIRTLARSRVSNILRQLRAANGLNYDELSSRTGIAKQTLFNIEYKEQRLTLDELRLLVDCYGVSVNDVLGIDVDS